MFRRLTPSCLAYGSLSEACVPFGIWGLLRKWVLFAIRKPAERCALLGVWGLSDLSESAPCSAYGSLSEACILFGVGRKRRNGARLHGFGNVLPGNATMGPFLGRAFVGFFLRNEVCREAPLSRFLPSGARDAARFSCDAFRRKVSSSRDWSCFEYHVFYGCEQQKWKHQIGG